MPGFKALPHRLQLVGEVRGVRWYNDSKATTPDSSIVALEAFDSPIIIAGGYDKHIPFDEFGEKIAQKAKAAILIGQTAQAIGKIIQNHPQNNAQVKFAKTLEEAVQTGQCPCGKGRRGFAQSCLCQLRYVRELRAAGAAIYRPGR